jgi:hypothetical protein
MRQDGINYTFGGVEALCLPFASAQWSRENDFYWDKDICSNTTLGGHLELLKWARENNCPWIGTHAPEQH